jgi:hypothetical protein
MKENDACSPYNSTVTTSPSRKEASFFLQRYKISNKLNISVEEARLKAGAGAAEIYFSNFADVLCTNHAVACLGTVHTYQARAHTFFFLRQVAAVWSRVACCRG